MLVSFSISKHYNDEFLYDVVPMDTCHLLLGKHWQFDREMKHNGKKNTYSFQINGKTITLIPLGLQQVQKVIKRKEIKKESLYMKEQQIERALLSL